MTQVVLNVTDTLIVTHFTVFSDLKKKKKIDKTNGLAKN